MRHASVFHPLHTTIASFLNDANFSNGVNADPTKRSTAFAFDASETDHAFLVRADLPGVTKEDISVEVDGDVVNIQATIKRELNEGERVLRTERAAGQYARSFKLNQDIDQAQVLAKYENGVLELTLPKKVPTGLRKISIQ
jgi:HSP20 family protein